MSLSERMEQLGCHCKECREILYLMVFRHSVENIQVTLTSDKNTSYFTRRPLYIYGHILRVSTWKEKHLINITVKYRTHMTFKFFSKNSLTL